jgi:CheY-like chemotaxis protein
VWNLLTNAIKFTPPGGQVEVWLESVGSHAQIQIQDTGIGIRADFLPYIFDRFRQADTSTTRSYSGLGLGLAIVRHLVELHGGTVQAASPGEGKGATFTLHLPLLQMPKSASSKEQGFAENDRFILLNGLRVLVVDDNADARELLTFILEQHRAEVTAVASATKALEVLAQIEPHILVSDLGMPGEDGYALIRQVRALPLEQGGRIPAIALTAYAKEEDRKRALLSGFQTHISKPVEPEELVAVVASLTGGRDC